MPLVAPALALFGLILSIQTPARVAPLADVYGRVLDEATFTPIAGAKVFLYPVPFPARHQPRSSVSDRNGEYAFTGIPEGFYRLGLYHDEYFPTHDMNETSVSLRGGERRGAVDLMMSQGASISGH